MGTLANSLFQGMMGWIRSLSSQIWSTAASPEGSTLLSWIGSHWKGLALLLCAIGAALDLIIYLIRWQPYRAWRSFFRRMGRRKDTREPARPETRSMEEDLPAAEAYSAGKYKRPRETYPDEAALAEPDPVPVPEPEPEENRVWTRNEPEGTTAAFEEAIRPRRRRSVSRIFAENEDAATPPDQLIDRYAAYRRPVYPRSWKAADAEEEDGGI